MPSFPTGSGNLLIFINSKMRYPETALVNKIQGTVVVSFVVDTKGVIHYPVITKSVAPSIDSEALRILSIMPKWKPGMHDGENVSVKYSLPVEFNISIYNYGQHQKIRTNTGTDPEPGFDLQQFYNDNLQYPTNAHANKTQGAVVVKVVVNEDGSLSDFKVVRSVGPDIDAEAIRLIGKMPKWKPAILDGKPAKVDYSIKIGFWLR